MEIDAVLTEFQAIGGHPLNPGETRPTLGLYGRHDTHAHETNLPNSHNMLFDRLIQIKIWTVINNIIIIIIIYN